MEAQAHGGVDIVVTHARRPDGLGDGDDPAHWGFESGRVMDTYHPQYLVHGHVHIRYGARERVRDYNGNDLINATERYTLKSLTGRWTEKQPGQVIYKTPPEAGRSSGTALLRLGSI